MYVRLIDGGGCGLINRVPIFCRNDVHVHTGEFTVEKRDSETFGILVQWMPMSVLIN